MTDKELLELAAKAAGYDTIIEMYGFNDFGDPLLDANDPPTVWDPLADDGDALRLAVELGLAIRVLERCVFVETDPETMLWPSQYSALEMYGDDPYAATRRAIVRVAAEIGKGVK